MRAEWGHESFFQIWSLPNLFPSMIQVANFMDKSEYIESRHISCLVFALLYGSW